MKKPLDWLAETKVWLLASVFLASFIKMFLSHFKIQHKFKPADEVMNTCFTYFKCGITQLLSHILSAPFDFLIAAGNYELVIIPAIQRELVT